MLVAEGASAAEVGRVWNAVFIASVLVAVIGTLLMAFLARMPYAQACGMGLNSFFCTSFVSGAFFAGCYLIWVYQDNVCHGKKCCESGHNLCTNIRTAL